MTQPAELYPTGRKENDSGSNESPASVAQTEKRSRRAGKLSPMLTKYIEYKEEYPDCLLFCQVGDFYELFFEDAVTVARALNLTLTSRDKNQPEPIPMCGVPIAVVDGYVERLVDLGHSVAVVSQCSEPVPGKMVDRRLERIVTPAIRIMGGANSEASGGEIIASVVLSSNKASGSGEEVLEGALAYTEVESGSITLLEPLEIEQIIEELSTLSPREVILPDMLHQKRIDRRIPWVKRIQQSLPDGGMKFRSDRYLHSTYSDDRDFSGISGFSTLQVTSKKAIKLLLNYVDETTVDAIMSIDQIATGDKTDALLIDATTRTNLELVKTMKGGDVAGSLYGYLKRTVTPGGARLLKKWILNPLTDRAQIEERLHAVRAFKEQAFVRTELQSLLSAMPDLERIAARIDLAIISPLELSTLRRGIAETPAVLHQLEVLTNTETGAGSKLLSRLLKQITIPHELGEVLSSSIVENPPLSLVDGGYLKSEYNSELERLRSIRSEGKDWLTQLEAREREETGIPSLKVKFNNVLGYFIEVTRAHTKKVPERYIKRQSMVNAERFTTEPLKKREEEILNSKAKAIQLERQLFEELKKRLKKFCARLKVLHHQLAEIDVLLAFSQVAEECNCIEPVVVSDKILKIKKGRHPILDQILQRRFIPNDLEMNVSEQTCLLLTGPNMGGKSTYLRQSALIVLLAHIGAFVPAAAATIGLVDRIFARLGASDDIAEGDSTFMVEMKEASLILSRATDRSLVLIDEIGRGTATSDGRALAQAILERIALQIQCRAIFATHFHELTALEEDIPGVRNISVGSIEKNNEVYFTHEICKGAASRSYGIEVATMAGVPPEVLIRARELLQAATYQASQDGVHSNIGDNQQLSFFSAATHVPSMLTNKLAEIQAFVDDIKIDHTTPVQALQYLLELKKLAARE